MLNIVTVRPLSTVAASADGNTLRTSPMLRQTLRLTISCHAKSDARASRCFLPYSSSRLRVITLIGCSHFMNFRPPFKAPGGPGGAAQVPPDYPGLVSGRIGGGENLDIEECLPSMSRTPEKSARDSAGAPDRPFDPEVVARAEQLAGRYQIQVKEDGPSAYVGTVHLLPTVFGCGASERAAVQKTRELLKWALAYLLEK